MKIVTKIAIASLMAMPASCAVERGVIVERQNLLEENALLVNLLKDGKSAPVDTNGIFEADRKLFFMDATYQEPFIYALLGDTIAFRNPTHKTYLEMTKRNRVHSINGIRERKIVKMVQSKLEHQK